MTSNPQDVERHPYTTLRNHLTRVVGEAFSASGYDAAFGEVVVSKRLDLCQFQCNGALTLARRLKISPQSIAVEVAARLNRKGTFRNVDVVSPGFINLDVHDSLLAAKVSTLPVDRWSECVSPSAALTVIIDSGGANVAKPLHVGHLRSAILGESIKRIGLYVGHRAIGDVHLGDWGLQMGMLIHELSQRRPELPYFDPDFMGEFPAEAPISVEELDELYPEANKRAQGDPAFMAAAKLATFDLQRGRKGYVALWRHLINLSVADLKGDYAALGVKFDLWLGESDAESDVPYIVRLSEESGLARISDGALVMDVEEPNDTSVIPPILLRKSDGAFLYSTTDLATILQRVRDYRPDAILYVVDNRQSAHFVQVFRAAKRLKIVSSDVLLEHVGFGTMNGTDGKPFKTRAGGTTKLKELVQIITDKALQRLNEAGIAAGYPEAEKLQIARAVGIASLKFGDFSNFRTKDYVFDLERFSSFEGRTGPYLLYTAVRAKSIMRRAIEQGLICGDILPPASSAERDLSLQLTGFGDALEHAWDKRSPSELCDYAYDICTAFSGFYRDHHILSEPRSDLRASYLSLTSIFLKSLVRTLDLLGIQVPDRM